MAKWSWGVHREAWHEVVTPGDIILVHGGDLATALGGFTKIKGKDGKEI